MKLGFTLLSNVNNINSFKETSSYTAIKGNPDTLYFRLINLEEKIDPGFLRYVPSNTAVINVKFDNINSSNVINRIATAPFASDKSIWQVPILASDVLSTNGLTITLTDGGNTYNLISTSTFAVKSIGSSASFC